LDQSNEMLHDIMPYSEIQTMPYKELLEALERRRLFLEKNKQHAENAQLEKNLNNKKNSQNNR